MATENDNHTPQEAAASQPASPSRRKLGMAALSALAVAIGFKKASETQTGQKIIQSATETGQKVLDAAPWQPAPDRPTLSKQMEETQRNLDAQDANMRGKLPPNPTQDAIEAKIKADLDANPANRYQTPTPTSKK